MELVKLIDKALSAINSIICHPDCTSAQCRDLEFAENDLNLIKEDVLEEERSNIIQFRRRA